MGHGASCCGSDDGTGNGLDRCGDGNGNERDGNIDGNKPPMTDASIYMPTLDLDRNSWSSNDMTFTHRKGDAKNSKELIRKTEAFKEWLSAKMLVKRLFCVFGFYFVWLILLLILLFVRESEKYEKSEKSKAARQQRELTRHTEEERLAEREQKLQEWLQRKRQEASIRIEYLRQQQCEPVARPSDPNASQKNYQAWLEKKLQYDRAVRDAQLEQAKLLKKEELNRRKQADRVYDRWLETARDKPKPVPLNRGLLSKC